MRSQRTALVLLFMLTDKINKVKIRAEDTIDGSEAVIVTPEHESVKFEWWGKIPVSLVLRPLKYGPTVNLLFDERLDPENLCLE